MNGKNLYNRTIDSIKGLAIIFVLITHYEWTSGQRKFFLFPFVINMAIPVFMIITGYVYSMSMQRKNITKLEDAYQRSIILKRFIRYTLPVLIIIIWELLDPRFNISKEPLQLIRWAINGTAGKGNYYYPVMMQLVFFFPVIYIIMERKKEKGLWICLIVNAVYEVLAWSYYLNTETYRLLVFRYTFLLAAGVYASKGYQLKHFIRIIMTVSGFIFICLLTYGSYKPVIVNAAWASTNFLSGMLIIPLMMWILQNVNICFKPLELIGKASYHIFLVQMVYYLGYYQEAQTVISIWQVHLVFGILICLLIGIVFYYVEKPLQKWLQGIIQKNSNR